MRWVRVKIRSMEKLKLPDVCPNCLSAQANVSVSMERTVGIPALLSIKTHAQWPYCARCAEWVTRHTRWQESYAMWPAAILFALSVILLGHKVFFVYSRVSWMLILSLVVACVAVAVFGCLLATMIQCFSQVPHLCLSNFPTVRLIRAGRAITGRRKLGTFDFANPMYVDQLIALNEKSNVTVRENTLRKAMASYERLAAKRQLRPILSKSEDYRQS